MPLFRSWRNPKVLRRRILFEQLEERIVLDAAVTPQPTNVLLESPEISHHQQNSQVENQTQVATQPVVAPPPPPPSTESEVFRSDLNVVLISNALDEIPQISQAVLQGAKIITYDSQHGNLITMANEIKGVSESDGHKIDNLIIIGHGAENALRLGDDKIDSTNVASFSQELGSIGQALSEHAQIQLFTCSLAKDASGKAFVDSVARLTGADVFASDDDTGGWNGDWTLEYASNKGLELKTILDAQYLTNIHSDLTYAPQLSIGGLAVGMENSVVDLGHLISVGDQDSSETLTVTLSATKGFSTLHVEAQGAVRVSGNDTGGLIIEGHQSDINETLKYLTGALIQNYDSTDGSQASVLVEVSDSHGHDDGSDTAVLNATINDANSIADTGLHVLVVSTNVQFYEQLVDAARDNVATVVYDPTHDSLDSIIARIETALHGHKADSIAFATHDQGAGQFYLTGDYTVNPGTLMASSDLQAFWQHVGSMVNDNGRIDLLACSLTANDSGKLLVSQLENITGKNFAASDDPSGNIVNGGDWVLESDGVEVGLIYFSGNKLSVFKGYLQAETKLVASVGQAEDEYGYSVSINGNYAVVGTPYDDDEGEDAGAAYIYYYNGISWNELSKVAAPDGGSGDCFGYSVSIHGDYAMIGAPNWSSDFSREGAVYVYHLTGFVWEYFTTLSATYPENNSLAHFGSSVSMDENYAIIGAWGDDENGSSSGAAYLFYCDGSAWIQQSKISALDGTVDDKFGFAVSISGDYALVGAYGNDDPTQGVDAGSAYIFHRTGSEWLEQEKLLASDGAASDNFGYSLSIFSDYALVGAYGNDDPTQGVDAGSAYIFHRTGSDWTEQIKLPVPNAEAWDQYGRSVSIGSYYALVGVQSDDDGGTGAGSAYEYRLDETLGWVYVRKLMSSDISSGDLFGCGVSVDSQHVIVGARGDTSNGVLSGSAYIFELNRSPELDNTGNMSLDTILEDPLVNDGTILPQIINSASGDRITDLDGEPEGIAVLEVDNANGLWQYSIDDGSAWLYFGTVSETSATLLSSESTTKIRFIPNVDWNGTVIPGITFKAWDRTTGSNGQTGVDVSVCGGSTAFSMANETASITVTAVNDAPTATNLTQSKTYTEGDASVAIDDIVVSDVDSTSVTATLILANTSTGVLTASSGHGESYTAGTGVWTVTGTLAEVNAALSSVSFSPSTNNDVNTTISVSVTDGVATPLTGAITLDVVPVNDTPFVADQNVSCDEDGTLTVTVAGTDADNPNVLNVSFEISNSVIHGTLVPTGMAVQNYAGNYSQLFLYTPDSNYNGSDSFQVTMKTLKDGEWDAFGTTGAAIGAGTDRTSSIALRDVNGDGKLDVVTGNEDSTNKLYLGNGDGSFGSSTSIGAETNATSSIALGDINGDSRLDVVESIFNGPIKVYIQDGTGSFSLTSSVGSDPYGDSSIALGDVNKDGHLDIVKGSREFSNKIYFGDGTGNFSSGTIIGTETDSTSSVLLGDVNDDGNLDVVVGIMNSPNKVYLGNGSGGFSPGFEIGTESDDTRSIALGDTNGDGHLDVVVGNSRTQTNKIYLGLGTGQFTSTPTEIQTETEKDWDTVFILAMDLNGDGNLDIIEGNFDHDNHIYLGNGSSKPTFTSSVPSDRTNSLAVGDLNGDGKLDLVVGNSGISKSYLNLGFEDSIQATVTITVTAVNDPPTVANLTQTKTYTEGDSSVALDDIVVSDIDSASVTATLTLANTSTGALTASSGHGESYNAGTGVWTISGILADVNAALASVSFTPATNNDVDTTIGVSVTDGVAAPSTGTITLDVTGVNDAPTCSDNTLSVLEDTQLVFAASNFNFSDLDGDTLHKVQITQLESAGFLRLNGTDVSVDQEITIGEIVAGSLTFEPATNANGVSYTNFKFKVSDGTIYSSSPSTMTIDVTAVNDAPVAGPFAMTIGEDQLRGITGWQASDPLDTVTGSFDHITITSLPLNGKLYTDINADGVPDTLLSVGSNIPWIAATSPGMVRFVGDPGWHGDTSFQYTVTDTGSGSNTSLSAMVIIDVSAIDQAPVVYVPISQVRAVDTPVFFDVAHGAPITIMDMDAGSTLLQVQLTATNGTITLGHTGSVSFLTGDGMSDTTMTFTGLVGGINHALDGLTFIPDPGYNGPATLSIQTTDMPAPGDGTAHTVNDRVHMVFGSTLLTSPSLVKDINVSGDGLGLPVVYSWFEDKVVFVATDGSYDAQLWISDATNGGTVKLANIPSFIPANPPDRFTPVGDLLFFRVFDAEGYALWVTDGTSAGTRMLDFDPSVAYHGSPVSMVAHDGQLYFSAAFHSSSLLFGRYLLYKSDGTQLGTSPTGVLATAGVGSNGSELFFSGSDTINGSELWISNGNVLNGSLIKDIYPGGDSFPRWFINLNSTEIFAAYNSSSGLELWASNGTSDGTVLLADINPGTLSGVDPVVHSSRVIFQNKLWFTADNGANGWELWVTDGTPGGTYMFKDINTSGSSDPSELVVTARGDRMFFAATTAEKGRELWVTDGTVAGTHLVKDINAAIASSNPAYLRGGHGKIWFSANDGSQTELWMSDGTEAGTLIVADVNFLGSSDPYNLAAANGKDPLFSAVGDSGGRELYRMSLRGNNAPVASSFTTNLQEDQIVALTGWGSTDRDGDTPSSVKITQLPTNGSLFLDANDNNILDPWELLGLNSIVSWTQAATNHRIKISPMADYVGTDSVKYTVTDVTSAEGSQVTVGIVVSAVNDAPVSFADTFSTAEDYTLTAAVPAILANDTDVEGNPLLAILVTGPEHGSLALSADGSFIYTPHADWNGTDSFTYRATDGSSFSNISTVIINVAPIDDPIPYVPPPPPLAPTPTSSPVEPVQTEATVTTVDIGTSSVNIGEVTNLTQSVEVMTLQFSLDAVAVQNAKVAAVEAERVATQEQTSSDAGNGVTNTGDSVIATVDTPKQTEPVKSAEQTEQAKSNSETEVKAAVEKVVEKTGSEQAAALVGVQVQVAIVNSNAQTIVVVYNSSSAAAAAAAFGSTVTNVDLTTSQTMSVGSFSQYLSETVKAAVVTSEGFKSFNLPPGITVDNVRRSCNDCTQYVNSQFGASR